MSPGCRVVSAVALGLLLPALAGVAGPDAAPIEKVIQVSYGDHIVMFDGVAKLDTPEKIERSMREWRDVYGVTTVYWRTDVWFVRERCVVVRDSARRYFDAIDEIYARFDPFATALETAHALGLEIYAYVTFLDEGSPPSILYGDATPFPWQSRFTRDHPEYLVEDRAGTARQYGVMEYGYPETCAHKLEELLEFLDAYDFDGVYLCSRTHSLPAARADQFGFNDPVAASYRRRDRSTRGVDIRRQDFDLVTWRNLRGEALTSFVRIVGQELVRRGKKLAVGIPQGDLLGPPYGNMTLDWRAWVRERLVDRLVVGVYSGDGHYPSMRGKDRERGYLASGHEGWGLAPAAEALETTYRPLCDAHGVAVQYGLFNALGVARASGRAEGLRYLALADARFSVEAWVRISGKQDYGRLVSQYDHTLPDDSGRGWEIYVEVDGELLFRVNDGRRDFVLRTMRRLAADRWAHVACESAGSGGALRIFVDGELWATAPAGPSAVRQVPVDVWVGCYPTGARPLTGWVAEIRLSEVARSPHGVPVAPLDADPATLVLWQPQEKLYSVPSLGRLEASLVLLRVDAWEPGPIAGLTALRLGS